MSIEAVSSRPSHVLVVDDDTFMVEFIADLLHELGIAHVTTAADGGKGIAALRAAHLPPDIVICDINMPNTDGFQMMEALGRERSACGFILISGLDSRFVNSATLMARFHHLNILGALQKPVTREALSSLIERWRSQPAA